MTQIGIWHDDLIWCPSQLELKIKHGENYYVIYLRWRHDDPWTGYLCKTLEDFDMHFLDDEWIPLSSPDNFSQDCDLDALKRAAINEVQNILNKI